MKEKVGRKYGTVSLPITLIDAVNKKIEGTGMHSVSAYVSFILRQILSSGDDSGELFSDEEEAEVKRRLKNLGYL